MDFDFVLFEIRMNHIPVFDGFNCSSDRAMSDGKCTSAAMFGWMHACILEMIHQIDMMRVEFEVVNLNAITLAPTFTNEYLYT